MLASRYYSNGRHVLSEILYKISSEVVSSYIDISRYAIIIDEKPFEEYGPLGHYAMWVL
jgi:hypothetical protein